MALRTKIVTALLALLFVGYAVALALRTRTPHQGPALPLEASAVVAPSASAPASASAKPSAAPPASVPLVVSAAAAPVDAGPPKLLERPLQVVALGWELLANDVAVNAGTRPSATSQLSQAGVETVLRATESMDRLEASLARGGADAEGADVIVLPMSSFVASYERLRALDPQVFLVTAYSRGRDALVGAKDALPPLDKGVSVAGTLGDPASFLALATLDLAGAGPGSVRFLAPTSTAEEAPLAAIDRDAMATDAARPKILLTSADATHLLPIVAVAPRAFIAAHEAALAAWAKVRATPAPTDASLTGLQKAEHEPGAPNPMVVLRRLGLLAPASIADSARFLRVTGHSAIEGTSLFTRAWTLWRAAGVLATPAPESAPMNAAVVAAIGKATPSLLEPAPAKKPDAAPSTDSLRVLLTLGRFEPDATTSIGFVLEAFSRSPIRVAVAAKNGTVVDPAATKKALQEVAEKFDVPAGRLVAGKKTSTKTGTIVEVLAAP